jgi:hypothetical protein
LVADSVGSKTQTREKTFLQRKIGKASAAPKMHEKIKKLYFFMILRKYIFQEKW